jgi:pilus assembly protein CpaF
MTLYERLAKARATTVAPEVDDDHRSSPAPAVIEVEPDPQADLRRKIHHLLLESLGPKLYDPQVTQEQLASRVRKKVTQVLEQEQVPVSASEKQRLVSEITDDVLGYGPLEPFLRDPSVTEIMVNGPSTVYVERNGKLHDTEVRFFDDAHLRRIIEKIVGRLGRRIDESQPYVDARLPDGSRVNAVVPPVAVDGPLLTVRKFAADPFRASDLIESGTLTGPLSELLEACVQGRLNILVSGGSGVGKTTTLNVLSSFIPSDERIVTVEDAAELQLLQPHVARLESRPANIEGRGEITIRDLVRNALRMRPDRIVVGEVRGAEALDMLQAMNTGHDGSMSTVHANSPRDALSRLEMMCLMAGMELPISAIRQQVARAVNLIVQQARLKDGSRRITQVAEVVGMEGDVITLHELFNFDFGSGTDRTGRFRGELKATGIRPHFVDRLAEHGVQVSPKLFQPDGLAKTGRGRS